MKILVLGAGAVGGYYGARLIEAGADVTFLVRPARQSIIRKNGLRVESPLGCFSNVVTTISELHPADVFDLVLLACKAFDLQAAADAIAPAVSKGAFVLPLLNGLGAYDYLDSRFGRLQVLGGAAYIATILTSAGAVVHMSGDDSLTVGPRSKDPAASAAAASFHALMATSGGKRTLTENIDQALWEKWVMLSAGAAMGCLMRANLRRILNAPHGETLMRQAIEECAQVAAASGFALSDDTRVRINAYLLDKTSDWAASMMRDIARGLPVIETDAIVGDMVTRAAELGLATPLLVVALTHLQAYSAGNRGRQT